MLAQSAERFADVVEGLKRMSSEMQRELENTRGELRKGILELPQETADSAAQMRRVIVDQIEALAELNRIVARHGRGLDMTEGGARRPDVTENGPPRRVMRDEPPAGTNGGQRPSEAPRTARGGGDITGMNAPPMPARRTDAPSLMPNQGTGGARSTGWLSDLLVRASRDEKRKLRVRRARSCNENRCAHRHRRSPSVPIAPASIRSIRSRSTSPG